MLTTIKLALKAGTFFQPSQVQDTDISVGYDQQQNVNQPKVLNQVNCVPLAHGIKSSCIYASGLSSVILDENQAATDLQLGPSTELTSVIDANGNLWYMLLDKAEDTQFTTDIYLRSASDSAQFEKYATISNDNRYEFNINTVFQNKTLFAALPDITYHAANTEVPHPDAVDPAPGDFFDVDLTAKSIRRFNLIGIGADVLDSVQCVLSYQNYMILLTRNRLYWSCPTDPYDFTPTTGGGGSESIAEVRGDILAALPSASGFIIYCRDNIVLGRFTGSTAVPFTYTEIKGSSGLVMRGEEALLVKNETNQIHYAVLVGGLSVITESDVTPLNNLVRRFIANDFTEVRRANTALIDQVNTDSLAIPESKVKRMYSYGTKIFFLIETAPTLDNQLIVYNIQDESIGILHGDYIALTPRLTGAESTSTLYMQQKVSAITDSFVLMRRVADAPQRVVFEVLDFGNKSDRTVQAGEDANPVSEFVIGDIALSPDKSVIVESIKLEGRTQQAVEGEVGYDSNAPRVRVFGYSEWYGKDSLLEFTYNEADNRYYGLLEGPSVRILVQGDYMYLTGMELRIDNGMRI